VSSLPSPSATSTESISTFPITSRPLYTSSLSPIASTTIQPSVLSARVVKPSVHLSSDPNFSHPQAHSGVTRSTANHFTKRSAISSTLLLSTTFSFKYTSVSMPAQTSTRTTDTAIPTAVADSSDGRYIFLLS